jgi:hypothetical protein
VTSVSPSTSGSSSSSDPGAEAKTATAAEVHDALRRLTLREKARLGGEILRMYARVRREIRRHTLPNALEKIRGRSPRDALAPLPSDPLRASRLGAVVQRTLGALPGDSTCLVQSLVLVGLLSRRGLQETLVIGVAPGSEFKAHAWVEHRHRAVLPAERETFQRLVEL